MGTKASPQTEFFALAFENLLPALSGGSAEATLRTSGLARLLVGSVPSSVASRPFRRQGYYHQFDIEKNHSLSKSLSRSLSGWPWSLSGGGEDCLN